MDYSEKWGTSIEEAVKLALIDLKLERDEVEVIVLEEPSKGFFGIGSDNLDMDMVITSEEKTLTDGKIREAFLFFFGQFKDVRENINGGGRLF